MRIEETQLPAVAYVLGLTCFWVLFHHIAMFSFASTKATDTGFPKRMFTLPISTRTLVAVPMVTGGLFVSVTWLFIAAAVLRAGGIDAPLWWPALSFAVLLAGLQAVTWTPIALSWLRTIVAILVLFLLIAVPLVAFFGLGAPEGPLLLFLASMLGVAYFAARAGVARGRRGDSFDLRLWHLAVERIATWRKPAEHPFSSPRRAQLWFECRAHAWMLPFQVALLLASLSMLLLVDQRNSTAWLSTSGAILMLALGAPPIVAGMVGGAMGKQDVWSKYPMPSFMAVRPLSTAAMVRAKWAMAAVSVTLSYALVFVFVVLVLVVREDSYELALSAAHRFPLWKTIGIVLLVAIGLVVVTWKQLAETLWIGLAGRAWVVNATVIGGAFVFGLTVVLGWLIYTRPEWHASLKRLVPWLLAMLVTLKLAGMIGIMRALARRGLVTVGSLIKSVSVWILIVVAICSLVLWMAPKEHLPTLSAIAAVVLLVPFTRLAASPLGLAWNRHR